MRPVLSLELRQLKAEMALKDLSLAAVAKASGQPYSTCSMVLGGKLIHPAKLAAIRKTIKSAPMPEAAGLKG